MNPDASVKALASTEVDVSTVQPGKTITVLWRGKPVFIKRRTPEEIAEARAVKMEDLKDPQKDEDRAKDPEWLVMVGSVLATVRTTIHREELERVLHPQTWKFQNMNLLTVIQLKLDNKKL